MKQRVDNSNALFDNLGKSKHTGYRNLIKSGYYTNIILNVIFAQVDQPLMTKPGGKILYKDDRIFLPFLIQLLTLYLKDSPSNQEDFEK